MRSKKAFQNMVASISYEIVAVICGFILPRLILSRFGSSYNGISSSITQFLSCVALLKSGVGAVTRAALYKPLEDNNSYRLSQIVNATSNFMRKIALIFIGATIIFSCIYPFLVVSEFSWLFSASLVLIMCISTFIQYYFGLAYSFLIEADQNQWILQTVNIVATVLNTLFAVVLIYADFGIHAVKLGSAIAFSINPLFIYYYASRKYRIDKEIPPDNSTIKQRWDAFAQSVAYFVHNNTDIMVLTIFSSLREVSVYTVYNYVIANIRNVLTTFVNGFGAAFGNMIARNETETIKKNLRIYELIIYMLVSIIYTTAGIMIISFVSVYTEGVTDVEYKRPLFAFLVTLAGAFSCFRIPYQSIVEAAGHFKQTKNGAILEAILNISISIALVYKLGLIGVAIGTLVATVFRSVQYAVYLSRNIIKRSIFVFLNHIIVCTIVYLITLLITRHFYAFEVSNYMSWVVKAIFVTLTSAIIATGVHLIFYRNDMLNLYSKVKEIVRIKKEKL